MTGEEVIDPKAFVMAQRVKWIVVWKRSNRTSGRAKHRTDMYLAYEGSWTHDKNCAKSFKTKGLAQHHIRLHDSDRSSAFSPVVVEAIFV